MSADHRERRPAAFLDRDGVINVDTGYPHKPNEVVLTSTAGKAIRLLNEAGYLVVVVTNQSGVARGRFTLSDVEAFHNELRRHLARAGGRIDAFYVAPYHPEGVVAPFAVDHVDRKPGAGMLFRAMSEWPICRKKSFLIGDKDSDILAAQRAGVKGVLVPSGVCDLEHVVRGLLGTGEAIPHQR